MREFGALLFVGLFLAGIFHQVADSHKIGDELDHGCHRSYIANAQNDVETWLYCPGVAPKKI